MSRIRGRTEVAIAKWRRARMPEEYVRSGRLIAVAELGELDDLVDLVLDLAPPTCPSARHPSRMLR